MLLKLKEPQKITKKRLFELMLLHCLRKRSPLLITLSKHNTLLSVALFLGIYH